MSITTYTPPPPEDQMSTYAGADNAVTTGVPHSREAEEAVLGSILISPPLYWDVSQIIKAHDFYIHRNAWIFEAFETLATGGSDIDLLTVSDLLARTGKLTEIGGASYLTSLINQPPTSMNAPSYAGIVKENSERRKGLMFANKLATSAYSPEPFSLKDHAGMMLMDNTLVSNRSDAKGAASEAIDQLLQEPSQMKFGVPNVDKSTGGLFKAELSILAGYQGTGKSAEEIHGMRVNAENGKKVMNVSLEMTRAQTWLRMACGDLQVDMNQVRSGKVSPDTRAKVIRKAAELGEMYQGKIVMYEAPMTPMDILAAAKVEQPDIIYIDHLGLMDGRPKGTNLVEWYKYCTRFLRQKVAQGKGNYCHVQLLHQLSRDASKNDREPTKHDLAYAGEDDADEIFILHREKDAVVTMDGFTDVKVKVEKSRFGWVGYEMVRFKLNQQRFYPPLSWNEVMPWQHRADIGD